MTLYIRYNTTMAELPIGEIQKLVEKMQDESSRRGLINSIIIILYSVIMYFIISVILGVGLADTKQVQLPINLLDKVINLSSLSHIIFTVLIISTLFLISSVLLWIRDLYMKNRGYTWSSVDKLRDWDFQGTVTIGNDNHKGTIEIKSSLLGMILKNRHWRNFVMTFEFFIPKKISYGQEPTKNQLERGFGIIYRARNLGQYCMLKIDENGFQPHTNNNQLWENLGPTITNKKPSVEWLDKWISVKMIMKNDFLSVAIGNETFSFQLPTYSLVHRKFPKKHEVEPTSEPTPFLPLTYLYSGSVGFRSAPLEEVHIKNFKVSSENLPSRILYEVKKILTT